MQEIHKSKEGNQEYFITEDTQEHEVFFVTFVKDRIKAFLERDDNSRITTGKKDTITRNGIKQQRRVLCDTMLNLHMKYHAEYPLSGVSYSLFCKLRPFYVVRPKDKDRKEYMPLQTS